MEVVPHDPQKKKVWGTQYKKVQTRSNQFVSFCNITTLNIVDIVDQLLRATESGRVCMGHV